MIAQETLVAFLATSDSKRTRAFYEGVLGLSFVLEHEHLITFQSGHARVALQKMAAPVEPRQGTSMGWTVGDVRASVADLSARGVVFERFPRMSQDEAGIWSPEPGRGVAWFKDPDGNLLSLDGPA